MVVPRAPRGSSARCSRRRSTRISLGAASSRMTCTHARSARRSRVHRVHRGKITRFQRENDAIPYCARQSGLYLAPRRTAFLSQSENLFTIPGEEHGREEDGCEEGWREEGRRQEVLGEEGRGKEGWRQEGGEVWREEGRREEGGEAHAECCVHEGDDAERTARFSRG